MELTYYGHSVLQIKTNDTTLLFDPFITGNSLAEQVVSPDDLNPDVILLTHAHFDHWGNTPEIAARTGALVVANHEIGEYIKREHNHPRVHTMNTGGCWTFDWGRVVMTYARHSSSFPDGTYGGNPNGYILYLEDKCLYNLGDTAPFSEMAWIGEEHEIDVALMPIGDCFTMGIGGAVQSGTMLNPKLSIPLHFDTFPPIEVDTHEWVERMGTKGLAAKVLKPGETISV
jgi:L-ascorbate metabolism protein UlaG (beta-lactamase superfamily)